MNAFILHFTFEYRNGLRNKSHMFMNYLFPLGFYFMMGAVMANTNPFFNDVAIPAMMVFTIITGTLLGLPTPLVEARETGILRSYKVNAVPPASVLFIPALTSALHLFVVSMIITATAPLLFDAPLPLNLPALFLCYILTYFACSGLGLLIGVISANTQVATMCSQFIYLPSMLVGGLMVPANILPTALQNLGRLLPATHAMNALRSLAMGYETTVSPWLSLGILLAGGIAACTLASALFSWDSKNTKRHNPLFALLALVPYAITVFLLP
jgi:ABC-2 type transport system permease protein